MRVDQIVYLARLARLLVRVICQSAPGMAINADVAYIVSTEPRVSCYRACTTITLTIQKTLYALQDGLAMTGYSDDSEALSIDQAACSHKTSMAR